MSANDELQAHTCEKILQEYGDVANNVAQANSQDLTEQWKKGELPYGYYYIKTISGGEVIDRYYRDCTDYDLCEYGDVWENRFEDEIIEVLAPVPSYDDWVYLHKARNDAHEIVESLTQENKQLRKWCEEFNALDVVKENQQLKELLITCKYCTLTLISKGVSDCNGMRLSGLITKIDNAIGEK